MKRKTMVPVAIVLLVLLDQLVKWYVVKNIPLGVVKSFIPHVVSLTYLQNTGAAFSLLENQQWFFTIITLLVMAGLQAWRLFHSWKVPVPRYPYAVLLHI